MSGNKQRLKLRDYIGLAFLALGTSLALIGTDLITDETLKNKLLDVFKKNREKKINKS